MKTKSKGGKIFSFSLEKAVSPVVQKNVVLKKKGDDNRLEDGLRGGNLVHQPQVSY